MSDKFKPLKLRKPITGIEHSTLPTLLDGGMALLKVEGNDLDVSVIDKRSIYKEESKIGPQ